MDWYHNTQFSDPDDDGVLLDATCKKCGSMFYVYADSLIDGQIPGGELCGDCETKTVETEKRANTGSQSDDAQVAAIEGGYDYVPEGYSVCPVCKHMSLFNDECQNCGYGSGLWWD